MTVSLAISTASTRTASLTASRNAVSFYICHRCRLHTSRNSSRPRPRTGESFAFHQRRLVSSEESDKSLTTKVRRRLFKQGSSEQPAIPETPEEREERLEEEKYEETMRQEQEEIRNLGSSTAREAPPEQTGTWEDLPSRRTRGPNWRRMRNIPNPKISTAIATPAFKG